MKNVFSTLLLILTATLVETAAFANDEVCAISLRSYTQSIRELAQGYGQLEVMRTEGGHAAASKTIARELQKKQSELANIFGADRIEAELNKISEELKSKNQTAQAEKKQQRTKRIVEEGERLGLWQIKHHFKLPKTQIQSATWSQDGSQVAVATEDGRVIVYNSETGEEAFQLIGHKKEVYTAKWSPDGKKLVTRSEDLDTKVWDASNGKFLFNLGVGHPATGSIVMVMEWSPSSEFIVTANSREQVIVWSAQDGSFASQLDGKTLVYSARWSADSKSVLTSSVDGRVRIWDVATEQIKARFDTYKQVTTALFSPDEKQVLAVPASDELVVWKAISAKAFSEELFRIDTHASKVNEARFTHDGTKIIILSKDNLISVLSAKKKKKPLIEFETSDIDVKTSSFALHPNDKLIATAHNDMRVRLFDLERGAEEQMLDGHTSRVYIVDFDLTGRKLLSVSNDGTAIIWSQQASGEIE